MKFTYLIFSLLICINSYSQKSYITIDNTKVWVNKIGIENREEGQPIVVFESGYGTPMDNWDAVIEGVSKLAPIVTYDRPGIGKSEPIDEMPTVKNVSDRLIRILNHLELAPPYILVGHSLGGVYVRGFANYYPELLAGLVFIDPADFTETHQNKRNYYDVLNWEDARVDSLIQSFIDKRKTGKERVPTSLQREGEVLESLRENEFEEITTNELPDIPVHIITGGRFDMPKKFRSKIYDNEALFRSKMKHRVSRWTDVVQSVNKGMIFYSGDAGHFVHIDDPELLVSSIRIVLNDYELLKSDKK